MIKKVSAALIQPPPKKINQHTDAHFKFTHFIFNKKGKKISIS